MDGFRRLQRRLGARVKTERQARAMTQDELASRIGLTRSSVANLETGRQNMTLETLYRLSQEFGVSPGELLGEDAQSGRPVQQSIPVEIVRGIGDMRRASARMDRLLASYRPAE